MFLVRPKLMFDREQTIAETHFGVIYFYAYPIWFELLVIRNKPLVPRTSNFQDSTVFGFVSNEDQNISVKLSLFWAHE